MENEKIVCCPFSEGGGGNNLATMMMASNGGMNGQWNNPFVYLVWMMMARWFGGNNGFGENGAENYNSRQIAQLQDAINTNHNSDLTMSAIKGNEDAVRSLANTLNCDFNSVNQAICGVRSAIDQVGGQVGFSSERVINAVLIGNKDLTSAIQTCCCNTQQSILKMGYENQIQTMNQTSQLQERLNGIANGLQQGFSSVAYESQRQTCDIINANNANTQRIVDTLNAHWNIELSQKLQDTKNELSQERQTAYLISQLKTTTGATA